MRFSLSKLSFFNSLFTILVISIALSIMAGYEYNAFDEKRKESLKKVIKDLLTKASAKDLVSSVVQVAQKSGIKTVDEFASSQEISKIVQELGIDYAQGYYYGKPEKQI